MYFCVMILTETEKYKFFAFALLVKSRRQNSIIYKRERQIDVAEEIGISTPT